MARFPCKNLGRRRQTNRSGFLVRQIQQERRAGNLQKKKVKHKKSQGLKEIHIGLKQYRGH
jgi:hypothetical protein